MNHGLHDPALLERDVLVELVGVQHRARGNTGLTQNLHGVEFVVLPGPRRDDFIHLVLPRDAVGGGEIARVANQVFPFDQLQQAIPVLGLARLVMM